MRHHHTLFAPSALAVLGLVLTLPATAEAIDDVKAIPWVAAAPGIPHDSIAGQNTRMKAVARGVTGTCRYVWNFGDGNVGPIQSAGVIAGNEFCDLDAQHVYNPVADTTYFARVHVCDTGGCDPVADGLSTQFKATVYTAPTRQIRVNKAISDALWYLHRSWVRIGNVDPAKRQARSNWSGGNTNDAATAVGCQAFAIQGHNLSVDEADDPYVTDVRQCINYITAGLRTFGMSVQAGGDPDVNGNGFGISKGYGLHQHPGVYSDGMLLMAIGDSGDPDYITQTGPANVINRRLADVAQDFAEYFFYGQGDSATNGGWWYNVNQGCEGSTNQWPVLGMAAAEAGMNITVPQWVKDRQKTCLEYIQNNGSGAFGYSNSGHIPNIAKTFAGLAAGAWTGLNPDDDLAPPDPSMMDAIRYTDTRWTWNNGGWGDYHWGSMYTMFGTKKGTQAFADPVSCLHQDASKIFLGTAQCEAEGGRAWESQYFDYFTLSGNCLSDRGVNQTCRPPDANGAWADTGVSPQRGNFGGGPNTFATAVVTLILSPSLFEIGPIARASASPPEASPGDLITFDHSQSFHPAQPEHQIVIYRWDWDSADGNWWQTGVPEPAAGSGYVPDGCTPAAGDCVGFLSDCSIDGPGCHTLQPQHVFNDVLPPGGSETHAVTLEVEDDHVPGLTSVDEDSVRIKISFQNHNPVSVCGPAPESAGAGNYLGGLGQVITLDGSDSTDPDIGQDDVCNNGLGDQIVEYAWDLDGNGTFETIGDTAQFTIPAGGVVGDFLSVSLRVTDDGRWAECFPESQAPLTHISNCTIEIIPNQPPVAVAAPDGEVIECTGPDGAEVQLDGTDSFDPDANDSITFAWTPAGGLDDATSDEPTGTFGLGGHNLTLTVTDTFGEQSSDAASFTVVDTTAPQLACDDQDAECESPAGTNVAQSASLGDLCDTDPTLANDAPALFGLGATPVNFTATDVAGNQAQCQATTTVVDTTPPAMTCENGQAECEGVLTAVATSGSADDVCDDAVVVTDNAQAGYPLGLTNVVYTGTDASGNSADCTATATVVDTRFPDMACSGSTRECLGVLTPAPTSGSSTDICDPDVTVTDDSAAGYPRGATEVTFVGTDDAGNASQCVAVVTIQDTQDPTIDCFDGIEECVGDLTPVVTSAQAGDVCDPDVDIDTDAAAGYPVGSTTVTYTGTDDAGHTAACTATATVVDTLHPTAHCEDFVAECDDVDATLVATSATGTDQCDGDPLITNNAPLGDTYPLGSTDILFVATDAQNLSDVCGTTVTVDDTLLPVVTPNPGASTYECGAAYVEAGATAADQCWGDVTGSVTIDGSAVDTTAVGSFDVGYEATDGSGHVGSATRTVGVEDTTDPTITCDDAQSLECTSPAGAATGVGYQASDICDPDLALTADGTQPVYAIGETTVGFTVEDDSGNSASCDTTVTVVDTTDPELTCQDASAECIGADTPVQTSASATDVCDDDVTLDSDTNIFGYSYGSHDVTWTGTDDNGNSSQCVAVATVEDTTAPTITVNGGAATVECTDDYADAGAEANDVCFGWITPDIVTGSDVDTGTPGSYSVTYDVTDQAGNAADQASRSVTVEDTIAPQISCQPDNTIECTSPAGASLALASAQSDACDADLTLADSQLPVYPLGSTVVGFSATDDSGNSSSCTTTVTVQDTGAPALECSDGQAECAGPLTVVDNTSATATDTCDDAVSISDDVDAGGYPLGDNDVTYTGTDASGNSGSCTANAEVVDTTIPEITVTGGDEVVECGDAYDDAGATADDVCEGDLTGDIVATSTVDTGAVGIYDVTYDVADSSGNDADQEGRLVEVVDTTAPVISCPQDVTVDADDQCQGTADPNATAEDICDGAPIVERDPAGNTWALGSNAILHTATDADGNASSCTSFVTVVDNAPPTADAGADQGGLEADSECNLEVTVDGSASTDNCAVVSHTWAEGPNHLGNTAVLTTTLNGVGAHTLTLTVCDAAGNCSSDDVVVEISTSELACFSTHKAAVTLNHEDDDDDSSDDGDDDSSSSNHQDRANGKVKVDGRYTFNDCSVVDLQASGATLSVDGVSFVVPAGAFRARGNHKLEFEFEGQDGFEWELEIDTRSTKWKFSSKHHDTTGIDPSDGLQIDLLLGDQAGHELVAMAPDGAHKWEFHADHATLCASAHHGDDDSSSDGDDDSSSDGDDDSDDDGGGVPNGGDDEPEPQDCGECDGKVTELRLRYDGADRSRVKVKDKRRRVTLFDATLDPGDEFTLTGFDRKGTLGAEVKVYKDNRLHTRIHTSCSQPIGVGSSYGDFVVVSGASRNGGAFCE